MRFIDTLFDTGYWILDKNKRALLMFD